MVPCPTDELRILFPPSGKEEMWQADPQSELCTCGCGIAKNPIWGPAGNQARWAAGRAWGLPQWAGSGFLYLHHSHPYPFPRVAQLSWASGGPLKEASTDVASVSLPHFSSPAALELIKYHFHMKQQLKCNYTIINWPRCCD